MKKLYVTFTLSRLMILVEDWLKKNKTQISFNRVRLRRGRVKILLGNQVSEEFIVLSNKEDCAWPKESAECYIVPVDEFLVEKEEFALQEDGSDQIPLILSYTANITIKIPKSEEVGRRRLSVRK